jgi:hypothetical protein
MEKQHFDQLVKGVFEMKRHMAGKVVRGAISAELAAQEKITPDIRIIRKATHTAKASLPN